MNVTVRNIPEEVISRIRTLSTMERRSLNSEILVILESGLAGKTDNLFSKHNNITKELQVDIWNGLAGKWEDERSTQAIIDDIYGMRTSGRDVEL